MATYRKKCNVHYSGCDHEVVIQDECPVCTIERFEAENKRLTMMLAEYVRLDNAGLIPMRPVAALKGDT